MSDRTKALLEVLDDAIENFASDSGLDIPMMNLLLTQKKINEHFRNQIERLQAGEKLENIKIKSLQDRVRDLVEKIGDLEKSEEKRQLTHDIRMAFGSN